MLGGVVPVGLVLELHPAKYPRDAISRPVSSLRMGTLPLPSCRSVEVAPQFCQGK
jgi:hypothetical protein